MPSDPTERSLPTLTIVIVSFNTIVMTRECLLSVFAGLGKLVAEIIVVDNASSDGSAEMIEREFPAVRLIRNSENRGFAAANNLAFAVATGEYVLLLNSDTVVLGDVLERSVEYMARHRDVGAMGCRVLNTDRTLQRTCSMEPGLVNLLLMLTALDKLRSPRWFGRYQYRHWDRRDERDVEVVSGCYLLTRRDVLSQVGFLDEAFFFFGEETDWCMRVRAAGFRCTLAPVGEIIHHGGGSVRKLHHKRDVMLTQALVRLHRKHGGVVKAATVWLVLLMFNASRWAGYSAWGILRRSEQSRSRGRHFALVTRHLLGVAPSEARAT
jgi:GT2 family glycosyltransferase